MDISVFDILLLFAVLRLTSHIHTRVSKLEADTPSKLEDQQINTNFPTKYRWLGWGTIAILTPIALYRMFTSGGI